MRIKIKKLILILSVLILTVQGGVFAKASRGTVNATTKRVLLIVIDRMTIDDLKNSRLENLKKLISRASVGLFSSKAVGKTIPASTYLTFGSSGKSTGDGSEQFGVPYGALGFQRGETFEGRKVEDLYRAFNGRSPKNALIMNIAASQIDRQNLESREGSATGMLGSMLGKNGFSTAVFGNSDFLKEKHREIVTTLMDRNGLVGGGNVSDDLLIRDRTFPGGLRTNGEKLARLVNDASSFEVIAVDWGDLSRIEGLKDLLSEEVYERSRALSLKRADEFIGRVMVDFDRELVAVASPTPPQQNINAGNYLSPIIVRFPDSRSGLLTSGSTRRSGYISNIDLAPTIARYLGTPVDPEMKGQVAGSIKSQNQIEELSSMADRALNTDKVRQTVLPAFVLWYAVVTFILLRLLLFEKKKSYWIGRALLMTSMSMPLVLLLMPVFGNLPMVLSIALIVGLMLTTGLSSVFFFKSVRAPIYVISFAAMAILVFDTFTSGYLVKNSVLSYCPIAGFRYYGIGNEYMGVLIATTLVAVAGLMELTRSSNQLIKAVLSIFPALFVVGLLGHPSLGTNFGGAAAALISFFYFILLVFEVKVTWRQWTVLLLIMALSMIALLVFNANLPLSSQSHIGRAAAMFTGKDFSPLVKMLSRKISMNVRTAIRLFWNWVVIVSAFVLYLIYSREKINLLSLFERMPHFKMAVQASLVGALAAFLLNDSGITSAAMILMIIVPAIGCLLLSSHEDN